MEHLERRPTPYRLAPNKLTRRRLPITPPCFPPPHPQDTSKDTTGDTPTLSSKPYNIHHVQPSRTQGATAMTATASPTITGIHHVTAIASNPQRNLDFYTGLLGLRLVKLTVNFDDPGTYHFYYGDEGGNPGTILTFFPWPGARPGHRGTGQATVNSFAVPQAALGYWRERLEHQGISFEGPHARFDEEFLTFHDPDGLQLELVAQTSMLSTTPWKGSPIPAEYAIQGIHSITLAESRAEVTAALLTGVLGFRLVAEAGNRTRYAVAGGGPTALVDLLALPKEPVGRVAAGSIHHIAWRTPDDAQQLAWQHELAQLGLHVSPVMDRQYFHSIYFREPGGVLFEIATDSPGFATDEPIERLGTTLQLPPAYASQRAQIEQRLPTLHLPQQLPA